MSTVMNSPILRNLTETIEKPYDGTDNVLPDRQGGWKVRHPFHEQWIVAIPSRLLADEILVAFNKIAEKAYASGASDGEQKDD